MWVCCTSVLQPKSNPAILTPANWTLAATVRAAPKATIEPARSFEIECIVETETKRQVTTVVKTRNRATLYANAMKDGECCRKD